MSRREMREYDSESRRIPVLMTFCRRRTINVYVLSSSNRAACLVKVVWNSDSDPVRTAVNCQRYRT